MSAPAARAVQQRLGQARRLPAVIRLVVGGSLAMFVTFAIGQLFAITSG